MRYINKIHTLGPTNTNCEKAAYKWLKAKNIEGEVVLHDTLEDAVETLLTNNDSESALLGCVVYPDLHKIVFSNLDRIILYDVFIDNTYDMVLASNGKCVNELNCIASHPAPSGLILDNYPTVNVEYATSNSNAGLRCLQGEVDGCITTKAVVKTYNLKELIMGPYLWGLQFIF